MIFNSAQVRNLKFFFDYVKLEMKFEFLAW